MHYLYKGVEARLSVIQIKASLFLFIKISFKPCEKTTLDFMKKVLSLFVIAVPFLFAISGCQKDGVNTKNLEGIWYSIHEYGQYYDITGAKIEYDDYYDDDNPSLIWTLKNIGNNSYSWTEYTYSDGYYSSSSDEYIYYDKEDCHWDKDTSWGLNVNGNSIYMTLTGAEYFRIKELTKDRLVIEIIWDMNEGDSAFIEFKKLSNNTDEIGNYVVLK